MSVKLATAIVLIAVAVPSRPQGPKHSDSPIASEKFQLFKHHGIVAWSCASPSHSAFAYAGGMAVDADGAYRAYHPTDRRGLDALEHAGHPGNWWALATDTGETNGRPVIQQKGDPAPGYYVSMTSLFDATIPNERDPHRFVDAAKIPYVVLPPEGLGHANLGDFATVVNLKNGKIAAAIVADESAPDLPMGEGSIALAGALGIDSNPRSGGAEQGIAFVIYPRSGNRKPRTLEDINANGEHLFQAWGGIEKLHGCLTRP
jgi:hypothetical protein